MAKVNNIIIHCSDSAFGNVNTIRRWHMERDWRDIGYHFVILNGYITKTFYLDALNGSIECGRYLNEDKYIESLEVGAHTLGMNNSSIGICLIGKSEFTNSQMFALYDLIVDLMKLYNVSAKNVLGHYETKNAHGKTCPNFDVKEFRENLS